MQWANSVIYSQDPSVCVYVYISQFKTLTSKGCGNLWLKGVSLILACNNTLYIFCVDDFFFIISLFLIEASLLWAWAGPIQVSMRTIREALWLDIKVVWPKSPTGGQRRLGWPLWSTGEAFFCPCGFPRGFDEPRAQQVVTVELCEVTTYSSFSLWKCGFVWFPFLGLASLELQHFQINRHKSNIQENHKFY